MNRKRRKGTAAKAVQERGVASQVSAGSLVCTANADGSICGAINRMTAGDCQACGQPWIPDQGAQANFDWHYQLEKLRQEYKEQVTQAAQYRYRQYGEGKRPEGHQPTGPRVPVETYEEEEVEWSLGTPGPEDEYGYQPIHPYPPMPSGGEQPGNSRSANGSAEVIGLPAYLPDPFPEPPWAAEEWEKPRWRCAHMNPGDGRVCATVNHHRRVNCWGCGATKAMIAIGLCPGESRDHLLQRTLDANGLTDWAGWHHSWCRGIDNPWKMRPPLAWRHWGTPGVEQWGRWDQENHYSSM